MLDANLPKTDKKRVLIVGAGFAGLNAAYRLRNSDYQVVLMDVNNFHQFQPLFYQVAMSGLEPSSIIFPLRKIFQKIDNVHIRIAELLAVNPEQSYVETDIGDIAYDELILATGAGNNFFGMKDIEENAFTLKSVSESIYLRNNILYDFERALTETDMQKRKEYLTIVIVGGGPTGVELAGALAEMRNFILPKDYKEIDPADVEIHLVQSDAELLNGMKDESSKDALRFLEDMGVVVHLDVRVEGYDGTNALLSNGKKIPTSNLTWAAGVKARIILGLEDCVGGGDRILVDRYNRLERHDNIYAVGDLALMLSDEYKRGHPQVAQVAIQQSRLLAANLKRSLKGKKWKSFQYKNKGTLATIGRNKAVADLPSFRFSGFFAWVLWLGVHLFSLIGVKNKLFVMINWLWNYFSYDQSLRLIIRPYQRREDARTRTELELHEH